MNDPYGWRERIEDYAFETGYPEALFIAADGRLVGTWILGNDYRVKSEFYGGYPATYLARVRSMFRDKKRVLHLFSGKVDTTLYPGDTVDVHPDLNPTYVDDAQTLERVPVEQYDMVLADPPYSTEDADHYLTSPVKRNRRHAGAGAVARRGTHRVARSGTADVAQGHLRSHGRRRDRQVNQSSLSRNVYLQEEVRWRQIGNADVEKSPIATASLASAYNAAM